MGCGLVGDDAEAARLLRAQTTDERGGLFVCQPRGLAPVLALHGPAPLAQLAHPQNSSAVLYSRESVAASVAEAREAEQARLPSKDGACFACGRRERGVNLSGKAKNLRRKIRPHERDENNEKNNPAYRSLAQQRVRAAADAERARERERRIADGRGRSGIQSDSR